METPKPTPAATDPADAGTSTGEDSTAPEREPVSGRDRAVDHERAPGVPPPSNDDYDDLVDHESADSFPASDPPSGW